MSCEELFMQELRKRGLRLTPQREMVLSALHQVDRMATAEEIYKRVQVHTSSVDMSTVYRTLELLEDLGLVVCVEVGTDQRQYELTTIHAPHIHLVCRACGTVQPADIDVAQLLAQAVQEGYGFAVDVDHLSVPGLCQACAAKGEV